jgi:FkbM family methyltransferase
MPIISYAQAKEDIHLWRALDGVKEGFYIDVGAWDPELDSVTKLFYDRSWRGVNIEPSPKWFARFPEVRPRDINLNVAVAETAKKLKFFEDQQSGLSTAVESIAQGHIESGRFKESSIVVPAVTLTQVCEAHCRTAIHFLKVDAEGAEGEALRSLDFARFRPWILCVESHYPLRPDIQIYGEWENYLFSRGYRFVFTDLINRYYVANEHNERAAAFAVPGDFFIHIDDLNRTRTLEARITELEALISGNSLANT